MQAHHRTAVTPDIWLILAVILHGLVYFILLPPWMGEDEPWHLEYARNLSLAEAPSLSEPDATLESPNDQPRLTFSQARTRHRTQASAEDVIQTQTLIVESMRQHDFWRRVDFAGWEFGANSLDHFTPGQTEAKQPQLYYTVCSVGLKLFGIRDIESQLWFLRGFSFLCYLAVLVFTYKLARLMSPDGWVAVTAVLVAAWLPMHSRQAALVSNDVLVKALSAAALWLIGLLLVERGNRVWLGAMILCTLLALATKATAIGLAGPLCLLFIAFLRSRGVSLRSSLTIGALVGGLLATGVVLYWQSTGSRVLPDSEAALRTYNYITTSFFPKMCRTFIGAFNWYTRSMPASVYTAVETVLAVSFVGTLFARRSLTVLQRRILALCWSAVACQLLAMMLKGFAPGRFLFPMLPALGTLIAVGWIAPLPVAWRSKAARLLIVGLILYDGFALWRGLIPSQYLDWGS